MELINCLQTYKDKIYANECLVYNTQAIDYLQSRFKYMSTLEYDAITRIKQLSNPIVEPEEKEGEAYDKYVIELDALAEKAAFISFWKNVHTNPTAYQFIYQYWDALISTGIWEFVQWAKFDMASNDVTFLIMDAHFDWFMEKGLVHWTSILRTETQEAADFIDRHWSVFCAIAEPNLDNCNGRPFGSTQFVGNVLQNKYNTTLVNNHWDWFLENVFVNVNDVNCQHIAIELTAHQWQSLYDNFYVSLKTICISSSAAAPFILQNFEKIRRLTRSTVWLQVLNDVPEIVPLVEKDWPWFLNEFTTNPESFTYFCMNKSAPQVIDAHWEELVPLIKSSDNICALLTNKKASMLIKNHWDVFVDQETIYNITCTFLEHDKECIIGSHIFEWLMDKHGDLLHVVCYHPAYLPLIDRYWDRLRAADLLNSDIINQLIAVPEFVPYMEARWEIDIRDLPDLDWGCISSNPGIFRAVA